MQKMLLYWGFLDFLLFYWNNEIKTTSYTGEETGDWLETNWKWSNQVEKNMFPFRTVALKCIIFQRN